MSSLMPPQPISSNTAHIHTDALTALKSLLHREQEPLYACGRRYLVNLSAWRDRLLESPKKKARCDDSSQTSSSESPMKSKSSTTTATPTTHPTTLLSWRAHIIEWMFDLSDSLQMERNVAVVAVGYLDVYCMYVLFPGEFDAVVYRGQQGAGNNDNGGSDGANGGGNGDSGEVGSITGSLYCLAATACFFTASKFLHSSPVTFDIVTAAKHSKFTAGQILDMEWAVLHTLMFCCNVVTPGRVLEELIVLLLDDEHSFCETGHTDVHGKTVVAKRNECKLGSFGALKWFPQNMAEAKIYKQSSYLVEVTMYSCEYPEASCALPSKIALAAILESAAEHLDKAGQLKFQTRLEELSCVSKAFEVDHEITLIRSCMRRILCINGCRDEMREEIGKKSPVTVMNMETSCSEMASCCASVDSIECEVNSNKDVKDENEDREDEVLTEGRVWEIVSVPSRPSNRTSSFVPFDLFEDEKPKAL